MKRPSYDSAIDLYESSKIEAEKQQKLYHFTNLQVLKIILETRKLRLSSLDLVNDPKELKYLDQIWKSKLFILSFTGSITEYFWESYAKGDKGVCIEFDSFQKFEKKICNQTGEFYSHCDRTNFSHKTYSDDKDWGVRSIDFLKVYYFDDPSSNKIYDNSLIDFFKGIMSYEELIENFGSINGQGFIKERTWEVENEYRLRVAVRPKGKESSVNISSTSPTYLKPPFQYIYLDLSNYDFSKIKVLVPDGFMYLKEIEEICDKYDLKSSINR